MSHTVVTLLVTWFKVKFDISTSDYLRPKSIA